MERFERHLAGEQPPARTRRRVERGASQRFAGRGPDQRVVAAWTDAATKRTRVGAWEARAGRPLWRQEAPLGALSALALDAAGRHAAVADIEGTLHVLDLTRDGQGRATLPSTARGTSHRCAIEALTFLPVAGVERLLVAYDDGILGVFDLSGATPSYGVNLQSIVRGLGWESFTFNPLYDKEIVIYGILIAGLWQGTGFVMCIMLAGLRGIDEDIWKAARVDGIPKWKTYLFIVIPMMRPVFITALVLIASGIVKLYDLVVAQTSGGPGNASEVPAKYVYDYMFQAQNLGQGFAASTMMLLTVLIVLIPWAYLEFGGRRNNG